MHSDPTIHRKFSLVLFIIGVAPYYLNDLYNPYLENFNSLFWIVELFTWIALPLAIFSFAFATGIFTPEDLGLHSRFYGKTAGVRSFLVILVLMLFLIVGYRWIDEQCIQLFPTQKNGFNYKGIADHGAQATATNTAPTSVPQIPETPSVPALPDIPSVPTSPVIPTAPQTPSLNSEYNSTNTAPSHSFYTSAEEGSTPFKIAAPSAGTNANTAPTSFVAKGTENEKPSTILKWLKILFFALSAGIVEELYFRGWLRRFFNPTVIGITSYVFISSLLFALIHWGDGTTLYGVDYKQLASTFCWGIGSAIVYLRIGNLWPLIIAHAMLDITFFAVI